MDKVVALFSVVSIILCINIYLTKHIMILHIDKELVNDTCTADLHVKQSQNIALVIPAKCDHHSLHYFNRTLYTHLFLCTMIPSYVVMSISGVQKCKYDITDFNQIINNIKANDKTFLIDIDIYFHNNDKTAAENKNYAVSKLRNNNEIEYITFFDFDDIVHKQRMEILDYIINSNKKNIEIEGLIHGLIQPHRSCKYDVIMNENKYLSNNFEPENYHYSDFDRMDFININELIAKYYSFEWEPMYDALSWRIFERKQLKYRIANGWYTIKKSVFYEIGQFDTGIYNQCGEDVACTAGTIVHRHQIYGIDIPLGIYCKANNF